MTFARQSWTYLFPDPSHLIGPIGVLLVIAQLLVWGRLVIGRRQPVEIQIVAGWGVVLLGLTLWGTVTPWPLWQPALALAIGSVALLLYRPTRPSTEDVLLLGRCLLLILPLLLVMLTIRPVMSDTLLNLLPNAQYLFDFHTFPRSDAARTDSIFPALPYGTQVIGYLSGWWAATYPTSAMVYFNVIMQAVFGVFLARLLAGTAERPDERPGLLAIGFGMLLTTALNPGFRPEINFADYGEPTTMITVGLALYLGARLMSQLAAGNGRTRNAFALALVLVVLVNIRQSNIGLVGALLAGFAVAILADRRIDRRRAFVSFVVAAVPALALYFGWRWFVLSHFEIGELKLRTADSWNIALIPDIFWGMWWHIERRPFLFMLHLTLIVAAVSTLIRRQALDGWRRLSVISAVTILAFNGFLFLLYISHFTVRPGSGAHAYVRYNAHMVMLVLVTGAVYLHETGYAARLWSRIAGWRGVMVAGLAAAMILGPVVLMRQVRYDLQMPRPTFWGLAKQAAARIGDDEKLAIIAPGDLGTAFVLLRATIAMTEPRRSGVEFREIRTLEPNTAADLIRDGYDHILVTCATAEWIGVPLGHAAFLRRGPEGWIAEDLGFLSRSGQPISIGQNPSKKPRFASNERSTRCRTTTI